MYCRICGDERDTRYYPSKRQSLCPSCAKSTPRKLSRETFDLNYWNYWCGDSSVPESTKREFYADYLASCDSFAEYIRRTTEAC